MTDLIKREDAISREDAIQAVNDTLAEYIPYFRNDQIGIPLKCARALYDLPSVTPSRPIGHWILKSYERKCSVCEVAFCETDDVGDYIPDKFCPNCGAKME